MGRTRLTPLEPSSTEMGAAREGVRGAGLLWRNGDGLAGWVGKVRATGTGVGVHSGSNSSGCSEKGRGALVGPYSPYSSSTRPRNPRNPRNFSFIRLSLAATPRTMLGQAARKYSWAKERPAEAHLGGARFARHFQVFAHTHGALFQPHRVGQGHRSREGLARRGGLRGGHHHESTNV